MGGIALSDAWNAFVREDIRLEPIPGKSIARLQGVHFAVKDVYAIQGYTSGAGNPDWLRTHEPSEHTARAITAWLQAGARLAGTTHTDELMYSLNGQNKHYGTPINPHAPSRIPGGSSSGSAAAVAGRLVELALGTDTGGSIRVPSSYCGIYGIRPTHGSVSTDGLIPLAPSFDTVGWMARDPKLLLEAGLALLPIGLSVVPNFKRILFPKEAWALVEPETLRTLEPLLSKLKRETEVSGEVGIAPEGLQVWMSAFRNLQGLEIWSTHGGWIQSVKPAFDDEIAERFQWASTLKAEEHRDSFVLKDEVRRWMRDLLGKDGLLVLPTTPGPAPLREARVEGNEQRRSNTMQLTCIAGLSGLPQVTVPAGMVDGAPIGLSFIAGAEQDLALLRWIAVRNRMWSKDTIRQE